MRLVLQKLYNVVNMIIGTVIVGFIIVSILASLFGIVQGQACIGGRYISCDDQ